MKKWIAVLLALLLAMGLATALADGEGETSEWIHGWDWVKPTGHDDVILLKNYFGNTTTDHVIPSEAMLFGQKVKVWVEVSANNFGENMTSLEINGAHLVFVSGDPENGMLPGAWSFSSYTKLKKLKLNNVTQENLKSMEGFLFGDEELSELDISCLDTSEVVSMKGMYTNCHKLQSINVSWMKTGNVTDMTQMFQQCTSLQTLDLSAFDTSRVEYFFQMFDNDIALQSVNFSSFRTPAAKSFAEMFIRCHSLAAVDVSTFDTSNVVWMNGMFIDCFALTELDLSNFNMAKCERSENMFASDNALNKISIGTGFRFQEYGGDCNVFPEVYHGPEWISQKEKKSFDSYDIYNNREGIADTYVRENPYTLSVKVNNVKATKAADGVTISYSKAKGADYYHIYRADNVKKQNFTFYAEVDGKTTKYTDTDLKARKEYSYYVIAVKDFYGSLVDSTGGPSKPVNWMKLAEIKGLKASASGKKTMKLSWKKTSGATGYDIYYATSDKAPKDNTKPTATSKTTSLTVKKLKSGKTYYVFVRPTVKLSDKTTAYGEWSQAVKVTIK